LYIPRDLTLWSQSWHLELRSGKMRSAVTEDRALQGWNPSAGDGPKLAGAACMTTLLCAAPSGDLVFSPLPGRVGSIRRPHLAGILSSPVPVAARSGFSVAGGMHKGGLSGVVFNPLLWGELAVLASVGGYPPAPASPRRGE
jgi:hypothetical protein